MAISTHLLIVMWALLGWGAAELDSLADLMSGEAKTRLQIVKKFLAAMAGGILTGLGVLTFQPSWGRMIAYGCSFAAAYGGAAYLNVIWTALADTIKAMIQRGGSKP